MRELQSITCVADTGTFVLSFRGERTVSIDASAATTEVVESALESLSTIGDVEVDSTGIVAAGHCACVIHAYATFLVKLYPKLSKL